MAGSVNRVIIVGNLGQDPEIRSFASGGKVANLRVATSETWRDKASGERKERTEWHRVTVYSEPIVKVAEQYLRKGSKVYIEGQLETRKWQDQSGQDRYSTEVTLRPYRGELVMLDGKRDDTGYSQSQSAQQASYQAQSPGGFGSGGSALGDMDDEVPFIMEWRG